MLSDRKKKIIYFQLSQPMNSKDKGNHGGITGSSILNWLYNYHKSISLNVCTLLSHKWSWKGFIRLNFFYHWWNRSLRSSVVTVQSDNWHCSQIPMSIISMLLLSKAHGFCKLKQLSNMESNQVQSNPINEISSSI